MRVALLHDWITGYRGGEKVLETLCELYPEAPLYTLVYVKGSTTPTIENRAIHTSFLQHMPLAKTKYRHYLPLFPLAIETMGIKGYDLIISTSHAVAKSVPKHGAKHWCFMHTPMRYVWDRFDDYFGPEIVGKIPSKFFFKPITLLLREYDYRTSHRPDYYAANSTFVADRIKRFYNRNAEVLYAPVDTERFKSVVRAPQDYYLFFSALVPYKKLDHAIMACQRLKKKLVIIGKGPEEKKLKAIADPQWIHFEKNTDDNTVRKHLAHAKALIFPAIEDFGIVPLEALSVGLPVIGPRMGGLLDTQTDETCIFYNKQNIEDLTDAIIKFERASKQFDINTLKEKAQFFSKENFKERVKKSINKVL